MNQGHADDTVCIDNTFQAEVIIMYIVGLNSQQKFYFISKIEQRQELEEKGILVLNTT